MHGGMKIYRGCPHIPKSKIYMPLKKIEAEFLHLKTYKGGFQNMGTSEASRECSNVWGHPNIGVDATEEN